MQYSFTVYPIQYDKNEIIESTDLCYNRKLTKLHKRINQEMIKLINQFCR